MCEGGALETDGEGTLLTTSSAVYTATRNPNWSRRDIEQEFMRMLGIRKVLWVDGGELAGDDTDSHIDQLVRFTHPVLSSQRFPQLPMIPTHRTWQTNSKPCTQ